MDKFSEFSEVIVDTSFIHKLRNKNIYDEEDERDELESEEDDYLKEDKQQCMNGSDGTLEFTKTHVLTKAKEKTIKPDLRNAGFSPNIVDEADKIYNQMKSGTKRGTKKKQLIFFCVSKAHDILGITEDPKVLAAKCGLKSTEISKAFSLCSHSKTSYVAPLQRHTPENFIEVYYQKLIDLGTLTHDDELLIKMKEICEEVTEKDKSLMLEEKPQTVGAAIVIYYLNMLNFTIDKNKYVKIFGYSENTLNKLKVKITNAHNS